MESQLLKYIYTVFLGILIAAFVGLGIDTFYQGPEPPEYPTKLERPINPDNDTPSDEQLELEESYQTTYEEYSKNRAVYSRNVSIIALIAAIVILIISLVFSESLNMLADGVLLGGILTLAYGIIRGFGSDDPTFRFIVITVGLIVAVVLGYVRFVKQPITASSE